MTRLLFKSLLLMTVLSASVQVAAVPLGQQFIQGDISSVSLSGSLQRTLDQLAEDIDDLWVAYRVPIESRDNTLCCWSGRSQYGCSLSGSHIGQTTDRDKLSPAEELTVLIHLEDGEISDLSAYSDNCPIDAEDTRVVMIESVDSDHSVDFMKQLVTDGVATGQHDGAIMVLAMHRGQRAQSALEGWAQGGDHQEDAIFWLGVARNEAGYQALKALLDDQSPAVREKIIFALSQNNAPEAMDAIVNISKSDKNPKVRGEALFWLSQSDYEHAVDAIADAMANDDSRVVQEKAVFALSQIEGDKSWDLLVDTAQSHSSVKVREEAIFWMSQSGHNQAQKALLEFAYNDPSVSARNKAVFGIAQLPDEQATQSLIEIMQHADNKEVRKQALFWLGQSDDPMALSAIEKIIDSR